MPLPNRVMPSGDLIADPARGLLMGNRGGRFHDPATRSLPGRRRWASKQWICCVLAFKGRHRTTIWGRGYTELFFCDEVTALAAGHRPCAECRRVAARGFQAAIATASRLDAPLRLPELDARLHAERLDGRGKRVHRALAETLPDGTVVLDAEDAPWAVRGGRGLRWTPAGYVDDGPRPSGEVSVLTPPTTLAALRGGYEPVWHPTADR